MYIYLPTKRFIVRNWLMQLWKLSLLSLLAKIKVAIIEAKSKICTVGSKLEAHES